MLGKHVVVTAVAAAVLLAGCETPTTQGYAALGSNTTALRTLGVEGVGVGAFTGAEDFSASCRAFGTLSAAGVTHREYIRRAFEEELLTAGIGSLSGPRVVLTGVINELNFSSVSNVIGGYWNIRVTLKSSNGAAMTKAVRHEFGSGFLADNACKNAADAFLRATQDLVSAFVRDPGFKTVVQSRQATSSTSAAPPAAVPSQAPTRSTGPVGQDAFYAEKLARQAQCSDSTATLVNKGAGYETYSFACVNGEALIVRCEMGNCRVMN